jgi:sarcosine oxidase delta subunit
MDVWVGVDLLFSLRNNSRLRFGRRWRHLVEVLRWCCSARNRSTSRVGNLNTTVSPNFYSVQLEKILKRLDD